VLFCQALCELSTPVNRKVPFNDKLFPEVDNQGISGLVFRRGKKTEMARYLLFIQASEKIMKKSDQRGFTLLELLISFAIVALLLSGTAQLTLYSVHAKRVSGCSLESMELASDKLEKLKSFPFGSQELEEDVYAERIESQRRNDVFHREWVIYDLSGSLKRIEMECYSESCVQRKTRLVLFYSGVLGF